jgi:hypothetical protein
MPPRRSARGASHPHDAAPPPSARPGSFWSWFAWPGACGCAPREGRPPSRVDGRSDGAPRPSRVDGLSSTMRPRPSRVDGLSGCPHSGGDGHTSCCVSGCLREWPRFGRDGCSPSPGGTRESTHDCELGARRSDGRSLPREVTLHSSSDGLAGSATASRPGCFVEALRIVTGGVANAYPAPPRVAGRPETAARAAPRREFPGADTGLGRTGVGRTTAPIDSRTACEKDAAPHEVSGSCRKELAAILGGADGVALPSSSTGEVVACTQSAESRFSGLAVFCVRGIWEVMQATSPSEGSSAEDDSAVGESLPDGDQWAEYGSASSALGSSGRMAPLTRARACGIRATT